MKNSMNVNLIHSNLFLAGKGHVAAEKVNQNQEKTDDKKKNLEENKIEKIEDKNQKISNNKSSENTIPEGTNNPETSQDDEKPVTKASPPVVDWSKEPSLLQTPTIQAGIKFVFHWPLDDDDQGEWKISTLGRSKKKKGKKGKGQSEEPSVPVKAEPENIIPINPEPKLPEPTHKAQEVIPEVKHEVIEKSPTPEIIPEKSQEKVEEVVEPIKQTENPKKTTENNETSKAQPAQKAQNTKPAKKRVIAAWTTEEKSSPVKKEEPETHADEQEFPSLGGPVKPTKTKSNPIQQKNEEKEEKKQETKPTVTNTKSDTSVKTVESKTSVPTQNLPVKQQTKPAPKIKGTDWGTPVSNPKKEQPANKNGKYDEEFPSL